MTTDCEGGALPAGVDRSVFGTTVPYLRANERIADNHSQETPDGGAVGASCVITHEATGCDLSYPGGTTGRTLSDRALELVNGDRQAAYGEPVEHAEKVAAVWRAMFGWDIDAHRFTIAMAALKLVREANQPKQDSRTDAVGWLEITQRIVEASS